jgi:hypothetical protein
VKEEEWEYELITGIRGDFGITDRFALLAEVAAANFGDAFYQGGIRISLSRICLKWTSPTAKASGEWKPHPDLTSVSPSHQTGSGNQLINNYSLWKTHRVAILINLF